MTSIGKLSPVGFNMSIQEKGTLYEIGYKAALEFIPKRLNSVNTVITERKLKVDDPKA